MCMSVVTSIMYKLLLIACLICSAIALPRHPKVPLLDGRIIGGHDADIADYPYQVSLIWFDYHSCGAILIAPKWALTAAHCTDGTYAPDLLIRAGTSTLSGGQLIDVVAYYQNPNYDPDTVDYDISILELAEEPSIDNAVPIELVESGYSPEDGTLVNITGWGVMAQNENPTVLQVVEVPVVDHQVCYNEYGGLLTDRMICAGLDEGGKDACKGDSGGPLTIGGKLAGIVSWGYSCALPNYPGVYAAVGNPELREFVKNITGI